MQKPPHPPNNTLNPNPQHQNISINISYNLNTHKLPKSIINPKNPLSKLKKIPTPAMQSIGNQFFNNLPFNPLHQSKKPHKKQNLSKKSNQSSQTPKQVKNIDKKTTSKKKKNKQLIITQSNPPTDTIIEYYNPLANNSKHFLKRNIQSPDIFKADYNRKLKTEASNYQPNESTFKKLKRSTGHMKETQSGFLAKNLKINNFFKDTPFNFPHHKILTTTSTMLKKPSITNSKTPKARKSSQQIKQKQKRVNTQQNEHQIIGQIPQARHNKSCMLYSTKKQGIITQPHLIQKVDHIFSTYVSTNTQKLPRKRAQSAYSFNKNGKELVTKLLNMSMISSQLGSSQLISSERMKSGRNDLTRKRLGLKVDEFDQFNHYQHNFQMSQRENHNGKIKQFQNEGVIPGNALRQYLNSIDLRIIKSIENDTANIVTSKMDKAQKLVNKSKQLDKNTFSINQDSRSNHIFAEENNERSQATDDVVSFYNKLFSNALYNKRIQEEQEKYLDSANNESQRQSLSIEFSDSIKVKKENFVIDTFEDLNQFDQNISASKNQTQEVYEFVKSTKPQGSRKLNFQHYKDLLNKQAKKEKQEGQDQNKKKSFQKFDFNLVAVENDMEFVPYSKKANQGSHTYQGRQLNSQRAQEESESSQDPQRQQKAIISLIDKSQRPSSSPSSGSSFLSHMRQEQVQKWNYINKLQQQLPKDLWGNSNFLIEAERLYLIEKQSKQYCYWKENVKQIEVQEIVTADFKQINKKNQQKLNEDQEDEESALISEERVIQNESSELLSSNKEAQNIKNKDRSEQPKQGKTSSRKKLSNLQPEYNEVCWEYNPDQLEREIQNYQKCQNIFVHDKNHEKVFSKTQKPCRQVYSNSPNNFSEDGNGSGEEEYDSKKYSQVSVYNDAVLEDNNGPVTEKIKFSFENKQSKKVEKSKQSEQLSNSLVDSLEDDQEDALSFQEKQIGSENRWINSNFAHHQSLNQSHHQSFSDCHGRIKEFIDKNQSYHEQNPYGENKDYLECDLASFGVKNQQQLPKEVQKKGARLVQNENKSKPPNEQTKNHSTIHKVLDSLTQQKASQVVQSHFKLTINGKQTKQKITLQVNQNNQNGTKAEQRVSQTKVEEKSNAFTEIRRKRLTHIVQDIILELIRQFARDISYILKKSSYEKRTQQQMEENSSPFKTYKQNHQEGDLSPFSRQAEAIEALNVQNSRKQQIKKNQFVGKCFGIDTSFVSVQRYLKDFKDYLIKDENMKRHIIKNINKDIGPNSLQILSYLRPQYDNIDGAQNQFDGQQPESGNQEETCDDQDGLFVVPSDAFSDFENYLEQQIDEKNKSLEPQQQVILTQKQKRNTNFWHRGIYQSWNQFLDYERPYGINGKPYEWVKQKKKFREVQIEEVQKKLQKGIDKLLEAISLPSGIIYDKYDLPLMYMDLSEEQKMYLNEQRLSRMLAIELFQSQQTWINYNDEMAELLVELSRIIQDRIFFETTTEIKKLSRKRNLLSNGIDQNKVAHDNEFVGIKEEENEESSRNDEDEESTDRKWLVDEGQSHEDEEQEEQND